MNDLFEAIEARLQSLFDLHKFNRLEKWRGQTFDENKARTSSKVDKTVFVEFIVDDVQPVGLGIKSLFVTIRFYVPQKLLKKDKRELLNFEQEITERLEGFASTVNTIPVFSSLVKRAQEFDSEHDALAVNIVDFSTIYKDYSGYYFRNKLTINLGEVAPVVTPEIVQPDEI